MPHVYIVTTGPGSNGDDLAAGGVVQAHRPAHRQRSPRSLGKARRCGSTSAGLVAHVHPMQHGGERLDRRRRARAARRRAAACRGWPRRARWRPRVASGWSEQISTSHSIGWSRSPSSLARARGGTRRRPAHSGTAACTSAATEPRGGTSGWNSLPTRVSALAMEMTTLPVERVGAAPSPSAPPRPTAWRRPPPRPPPRRRCPRPTSPRGRGRANAPTSSTRTASARSASRDPSTTW